MTFGVDTTFLVQLEVRSALGHEAARAWLHDVIERGCQLAVAPQVLTEFIHVATDPERFERPLSMPAAAERANRRCYFERAGLFDFRRVSGAFAGHAEACSLTLSSSMPYRPPSMPAAADRAQAWWTAREVFAAVIAQPGFGSHSRAQRIPAGAPSR